LALVNPRRVGWISNQRGPRTLLKEAGGNQITTRVAFWKDTRKKSFTGGRQRLPHRKDGGKQMGTTGFRNGKVASADLADCSNRQHEGKKLGSTDRPKSFTTEKEGPEDKEKEQGNPSEERKGKTHAAGKEPRQGRLTNLKKEGSAESLASKGSEP